MLGFGSTFLLQRRAKRHERSGKLKTNRSMSSNRKSRCSSESDCILENYTRCNVKGVTVCYRVQHHWRVWPVRFNPTVLHRLQNFAGWAPAARSNASSLDTGRVRLCSRLFLPPFVHFQAVKNDVYMCLLVLQTRGYAIYTTKRGVFAELIRIDMHISVYIAFMYRCNLHYLSYIYRERERPE